LSTHQQIADVYTEAIRQSTKVVYNRRGLDGLLEGLYGHHISDLFPGEERFMEVTDAFDEEGS